MGKMKDIGRALAARFSGRQGQMLILFAMEGFLFQFVMSMSGSGGFGTNLYATNLGATDTQIGMVQLVANLAAVVMMLPAGIIADRTKNAKTVPVAIMLLLTATYALYGTIPAFGAGRMTFFFLLLPLTAGMLAIYNAIWQAFFGDVTPIRERNRVYAFRNRSVYLIATIAPVVCGSLLTAMPDAGRKLTVLRVFFYLCAAFNLVNAWILSRIPGGQRSAEQLAQVPKISLRVIGRVVGELARSRRFLAYFLPVMLFYTTWHLDWSMWYIGQTQYIRLTEAELSIYSALTSVGQLALIGLCSRMIERRGTKRTFVCSLVSLMFCPVFMLVCCALPAGVRAPAFIVLGTLICAPQAATNLCLVQMLLDAIPEKNRSLIVSLNMICVTLSNGLMPYLGVKLYSALGADGRAFAAFMMIETIVRAASLLVYLLVQFRGRRAEK